MPWGEAYRLTMRLLEDPGSHVGAEVSGWSHPMTREGLVLLDIFDLTHHIGARKRTKPHHMRPTKRGLGKERRGRDQVLSQEEIIAVLQAAGHTAPVPTRASP